MKLRIKKEGWAVAVFLLFQFFPLLSIQAAPRWPLPPIPEFVPPLYSETFDENFSYGETAARLTVGSYVLNESWSGYALQRSGAVIPFVIPGMDATGHTNISCHNSGALRFWFKPDWSSVSIAGGTGPGATAQLAELDAVVSKQSAVDWSLQISADGNTLVLLDPNGNALLKTSVSWIEGQPHLITLDYHPQWTALFVDAELAAQGAGVTELLPKLAVLVLGSSLMGENPAQGDFDEFYSFPKLLSEMDVQFCYNFNSGNVALGPISREEIAAKQKLIAARKAQRATMRSASMSSSLAAGGTSGLLSLGCACNCNCATGGQVYFTNLTATLTTNQGMVVSFNLAGGTNAIAYGVFTTTNIGSPQWKWIGNAYTCATVYLTNQPADAAFYALGASPSSMIVPWGDDTWGQCTYGYPTNATNIISVAAGVWHSIALKADGTVTTWGYPTNYWDGPNRVPTNITGGITAVSAGWIHNLALLTNGTVIAWSDIPTNETASLATNVPVNLTNVVAISANFYHNLALRCDGTVVGWGWYTAQGETNVPVGLSNIVAIATGPEHDLAVNSNGMVVAWGNNNHGQCNVPSSLSNVVAVAAGWWHSVALKKDGTVVSWGYNAYGETNVPAGLSNVVAIAAGGLADDDMLVVMAYDYVPPTAYSLALKSDGTLVAWGNGTVTNIAFGMNRVFEIAGGTFHSVALRSAPLTPVIIQRPVDQYQPPGGSVTFDAQGMGVAGIAYQWQFSGASVAGATNTTLTLTNVNSGTQGNYQVVVIDGNGSVTSSPAILTVVTPPVITSQSTPTNPVYIYGNYISFGATATAPGQSNGFAVSYQWQLNGTNISGATNTTYSLYADDNAAGTYKFIASNAAGSTNVTWQVTLTNAIDAAKDLLLIYNTNSADSIWVKDYYLAHRPMVSGANVLGIGCTNIPSVRPADYTNNIAVPVQNWLVANPTKRPQYIVLMAGIPWRVNTNPSPIGLYYFPVFDTNTGTYIALPVRESVQYQLHYWCATNWQPFVTSLNMGEFGLRATTNDPDYAVYTNACKAYIDKLEFIGTNYSPGKLVISASTGSYGNTNYYFDNCPSPVYTSAGSPAAGVLSANPLASAVSVGGDDGFTNLAVHITSGTNVVGYLSRGSHSALGNQYAIDSKVKWFGNSGWWIIETLESYNGLPGEGQGDFWQWFSSNAFAGTNYSNIPVGAVTHVDEPFSGVNDASIYFGLWERRKNFAICAWNSSRTLYFQAVGDPFVTK